MELMIESVLQGSADERTAAVPPSDDEAVLTLALATSQALRALVGLKLAQLGLASGQDRLLIALSDHDTLTVSVLAAELNVRPSTVSKMLDRMTDRGYTQRLPDAVDARRINVALTPDGRHACYRLRTLRNEIGAELATDLSPEEAKALREGLALLNRQVALRLRKLR